MGIIAQRHGETVLNAGSGGTIAAFDPASPYDSNVGIRFNTDGTVERGSSINGAAITWSSHGAWIDPLSAASGNFSVRYTNRANLGTGTYDFTTKAAVEDTWIATSSQRVWTWNETSQSLADEGFTCDFEVRDDVGSIVTGSSSYTFSIENAL